MLHKKRNHHSETPRHCNKETAHSPQLEKAHVQQQRPNATKIKIKQLLKCYADSKSQFSTGILTVRSPAAVSTFYVTFLARPQGAQSTSPGWALSGLDHWGMKMAGWQVQQMEIWGNEGEIQGQGRAGSGSITWQHMLRELGKQK